MACVTQPTTTTEAGAVSRTDDLAAAITAFFRALESSRSRDAAGAPGESGRFVQGVHEGKGVDPLPIRGRAAAHEDRPAVEGFAQAAYRMGLHERQESILLWTIAIVVAVGILGAGVVTVLVTGFIGPYSEQIRVMGEAAKPQALPYKQKMTLLDVMIVVGGLTDFADGNRAIIQRSSEGNKQYSVRLKDLIKRGDVSANVEMKPGDILVIPQSLF